MSEGIQGAEINKISYTHRLKLREIILDKLLLGVALALFALFGDYLITNYQNEQEQRTFLFNARLSAIQEINESYSALYEDLVAAYNRVAYKTGPQMPPTAEEKYQRNLDRFVTVTSKWGVLFSAGFQQDMGKHIYLHSAVAENRRTFTPEHRPFLLHLNGHFEQRMRSALWEETVGATTDPSQKVEVCGSETVPEWESQTGEGYFDKCFGLWGLQSGVEP